jgi:hypothetical protein
MQRKDPPAEVALKVTSLHVANSTAWQSAAVQYNVYATNSHRYGLLSVASTGLFLIRRAQKA